MVIPKVVCPKCGLEMEDVSLGWKCRMCHGFVDMHYIFHEHKEEPFMPPQTNADRIRAMSDEELAVTIYRFAYFCPNKAECWGVEVSEQNCANCLKEWLQQPAEEVHHE